MRRKYRSLQRLPGSVSPSPGSQQINPGACSPSEATTAQPRSDAQTEPRGSPPPTQRCQGAPRTATPATLRRLHPGAPCRPQIPNSDLGKVSTCEAMAHAAHLILGEASIPLPIRGSLSGPPGRSERLLILLPVVLWHVCQMYSGTNSTRGFMSLQSAHTRTQTHTHLLRPVRLSGSEFLMMLAGDSGRIPPYVRPRLRDPQGPPGSRVRCNKQKSLFHASMGSVPLTLPAWWKSGNYLVLK
uniref:Uncharacterized protein n=1 Tax=Pipistrellus kuhlii TaxID=59472 RepID=A0A7J8B1G3_PIPKU|nr:hypothetical protein mPipKuh1_007749 [Pipistrellus kuhlii]